MTFDELSGQHQPLAGQYPTGVIDWGSSGWWLSGPWGPFTTKSASYSNASITSARFTFVTPRRLLSVRAYNGGSGATTLTAQSRMSRDDAEGFSSPATGRLI